MIVDPIIVAIGTALLGALGALCTVIGVLWRDNLKLRAKLELASRERLDEQAKNQRQLAELHRERIEELKGTIHAVIDSNKDLLGATAELADEVHRHSAPPARGSKK
jgi:hypothetical protein